MSPSKPRRSPAPEQRQRDAERTRQRILEAATTEFAANGYAGARVAAIASRAKVNQQLISYYFDGKQGLYQAVADNWWSYERELVPPGTSPGEAARRYVLQALHNPDGARQFAWSGLEYQGSEDDPDRVRRSERLRREVDVIRALQAEGKVSSELDPACLVVMMMAAAMGPTTLPHVIEGLYEVDARSSDFLHHYADQVALVSRLLGLDGAPSGKPADGAERR
ncbi:TetR/AcrR family transcriptional regulator [Amycolatopsis alba]|uniref:TetR/AcrR family transcriptional regulator n=1 Tax=Amycolatopsis alba DSM 44262 TaxID=1125972 RepID=A0A229RC81_AMYAL|nr:TetR/AcrR family transcriptional regulator [Amycolatopsis alba]OXM44034.1 TetR/AcrR family transcriptional regulator [Amycolatopsis alba DSM 44262]